MELQQLAETIAPQIAPVSALKFVLLILFDTVVTKVNLELN